MVDKINLLNCQVYREAICHPCRINEGEEFTISWADGGPEVKVQMFNKKGSQQPIFEHQVGSLSCLWLEDQFCLTFPASLETATKATLLGAFFLIDFNYY